MAIIITSESEIIYWSPGGNCLKECSKQESNLLKVVVVSHALSKTIHAVKAENRCKIIIKKKVLILDQLCSVYSCFALPFYTFNIIHTYCTGKLPDLLFFHSFLHLWKKVPTFSLLCIWDAYFSTFPLSCVNCHCGLIWGNTCVKMCH